MIRPTRGNEFSLLATLVLVVFVAGVFIKGFDERRIRELEPQPADVAAKGERAGGVWRNRRSAHGPVS